jgi:hypothetical protein
MNAPTTPNEALIAYKLLDDILKSPDTRHDALKLLKKHNPKVVIPELDAAAPYEARLAGIEKKLEDSLKALSDRDADGALASKFDQLRQRRGYTDEGVEKIKKIMLDHSVADPEIAANHFDASQAPADPALPVGYSPTQFVDSGSKDLEPWFQNEDRAADAEVIATLRDIRAGKL